MTPTADNLLKGATPLPWSCRFRLHDNPIYTDEGKPVVEIDADVDEPLLCLSHKDAALIVFAVNNLPAHLAELKALRAENERLRAEIERRARFDWPD